jgi:MFS family permease
MALNQFSGCFAIITYTATIFKESGSNMDANLASIIVAVLQILGTYCSTICVDRTGRKILLLVSACGTSIGLASMGCFSFLNQQGYDVSSLSWVPILSLSFVVFIASIGILTLPFLVLAELLPNKVNILCLLVNFFNGIFIFSDTRYSNDNMFIVYMLLCFSRLKGKTM